jgi:hypothetical protein
MAKTAVLTMSVQISGDGVNETYNLMAATPFVNSNAPGGGPVLTARDNPLTVPPNTLMMFIQPLATSTVVLKLKGIAGDMGFTLGVGQVAMVPLPPGTTQVLLNASLAVNVSILYS